MTIVYVICLFVRLWSHWRIFHSYEDATFAGDQAANFDLGLALTAIQRDTGHQFIIRHTHTYCRVFSSGAIATWSAAAEIRTPNLPLESGAL